jgi:hypothetical protein
LKTEEISNFKLSIKEHSYRERGRFWKKKAKRNMITLRMNHMNMILNTRKMTTNIILIKPNPQKIRRQLNSKDKYL